MATDNYNELESQIGDLGEPEVPQKKLGKLQHKAAYGQREDLSSDEMESMKAFQAKIKADRDQKAEMMVVGDGWIQINREEMGIRSDFYPREWDFFVKPATVSAIKNWTAVDESNTAAVYRVLNEIIRSSVKIDTNGVGVGGWGQINSWDRFWFILKVREVTFVRGESKVEFEDQCSECGADLTYNLTADKLYYTCPDDDLIEKYWDGSKWEIDPTEYDVAHEPITLYTPKLSTDEKILEWATAQARAKKTLDENFIRFLSWMLPNPSRDANVLSRQIEKAHKEYKSWTIEMYEFMDEVIRNLQVDPSENLKMVCPNCGQEAISNVRFPDGIKVLFRTESKAKKFGSR